MVKLSVIILTFNTQKLTSRCVKSLINNYKKNIENGDMEIIVADNGSEDDTISTLTKVKYIKVVENKKNYGFSKGNNLGAKVSKGKYILFLNSDVEVEDNGFLSMIEFMDNNANVGILGGKLLNPDGSTQLSTGNFYNFFSLLFTLFGADSLNRKKPNKIQKVDWVSGASLMIRKDLFDNLRGFDENFFMYIEDMDLCFRAKKRGFSTYFWENIKLIHKELGSSNRSFAILNIYKGIILFSKKHSGWQYPFIRFMLFLKAAISILIGLLTNNSYLRKTYSGALRIAI